MALAWRLRRSPVPVPRPGSRHGLHIDRRRGGRVHRLPGQFRLSSTGRSPCSWLPSWPGSSPARSWAAGQEEAGTGRSASRPSRLRPPARSRPSAPCRASEDETVPFALLAAFGILSGFLFVSANRLVAPRDAAPGPRIRRRPASPRSPASILASALLIPLFGIPALILRLALLNALCFLFLLVPSSTA
ncbi:MAG: hypothetical protein MZU95_01930 [Desulfomicrobium escambiense]|nr:hypothetical protein [Desulfomicrobium escambiense]